MSLINFIQYYNGTEYTHYIPHEIAQKFESVIKYNIVGFKIEQKYKNYCNVSFRGKDYNAIISKLTNKSLYNTLITGELNVMSNKFEMIFDIIDENKIKQITNINDNKGDLVELIKTLIGTYVPSPNEIIGLMEIFKICYENNLNIYAL